MHRLVETRFMLLTRLFVMSALSAMIGLMPNLAQAQAAPGQLIISEFRYRGPTGMNDEFIEIYNASGPSHIVNGSGSGTGYGIAASDGSLRCTIPDGTLIPNRGHFLCVNSAGYSLGAYPSGNGTTAAGDATYTADIAETQGIALFNTNIPAEFSFATRLDAVGPASAFGGAFNSSLSAGPITLATPLANEASVDIRFLLGVQQTGLFKFYINIGSAPLITNALTPGDPTG